MCCFRTSTSFNLWKKCVFLTCCRSFVFPLASLEHTEKGRYLDFPGRDSWGFFFGKPTYYAKRLCKFSACRKFFPTKNVQHSDYYETRHHHLCLKLKRWRGLVEKGWFSNRVILTRNSLPELIVLSDSIACFRYRLNNFDLSTIFKFTTFI